MGSTFNETLFTFFSTWFSICLYKQQKYLAKRIWKSSWTPKVMQSLDVSDSYRLKPHSGAIRPLWKIPELSRRDTSRSSTARIITEKKRLQTAFCIGQLAAGASRMKRGVSRG
ncbi:uncharacterized protein LOC112590354 [Harpegnathos saltator]|uniref:uncharacterized protein LOC112588893 n=1 Tax=Harpegnathos saltator TaxID=610380 RepID=UPI000DBEF151|nr:uncharacterized protein LOC112588893 [Harpegnathos saltator]XP_025156004.1 uncharacterized protein LOC112588895 [Harpegnathos saltator]XP_025162389.1 uncharacterized protein LOC112590353 [Harpegnathos saltator]XP_025162391.1 uncharacterized protein LOC112590354 [Harpegnathos saltator]